MSYVGKGAQATAGMAVSEFYLKNMDVYALCKIGVVVKLIDAVRDLVSLDEGAMVYAMQPWTAESEVTIVTEPELKKTSARELARGMKYFLEVFIAKDFIDGWVSNLKEPPSLAQRCERLIEYAVQDA